jgi:hypothetical protein
VAARSLVDVREAQQILDHGFKLAAAWYRIDDSSAELDTRDKIKGAATECTRLAACVRGLRFLLHQNSSFPDATKAELHEDTNRRMLSMTATISELD